MNDQTARIAGNKTLFQMFAQNWIAFEKFPLICAARLLRNGIKTELIQLHTVWIAGCSTFTQNAFSRSMATGMFSASQARQALRAGSAVLSHNSITAVLIPLKFVATA